MPYERILGIKFLDASVATAFDLLGRGGLMIVPSAPVLASLPYEDAYREAALESDFAIVDSGYLALLWFGLRGRRLHRTSGLAFLRDFFALPQAREPGALFLVNPTDDDARANVAWLRSRGIEVPISNCYTAPRYDRDSIADLSLVEAIERVRPNYVIINLGGGIQEPLGLHLKKHLSYTPGIICTGAAIAFLTGRQASIPWWADRAGLGWLLRCISSPRVFVPRYARAITLAPLLVRYGREMPPRQKRARSS
jgi:N-acetylglucosaminyldiphosphoundecaprenol N-acetyl-beta-D-mannosaminyltransferase